MNKKLFIILIFSLFSSIYADTIYLIDGRTLTGIILSMTDSQVVLQTDYGKVEIDRSKIAGGIFYTDQQNNEILVRKEYKTILDLDFLNSLNDYSPYMHKVSKLNNILFDYNQEGLNKAAVTGDGNNSYLTITPSDKLKNLNEFTITSKLKLTDITKPGYIFSYYGDKESKEGKFSLFQQRGYLSFYIMDNNKQFHIFAIKEQVIKNNEWFILTITFDGKNLKIYINNTVKLEKDTNFSNTYNPSINFYILTGYHVNKDSYTEYNIPGSVDYFKILDKALSQEEIFTLN